MEVHSDSIFYGEPIIDGFVEKIFAFTQKVKALDEKFISKVSELYQEDGELYIVEADKGYRIMLAAENLENQLSRFNFVENNRIFEKNNIVDLRFADQLIIRKENR